MTAVKIEHRTAGDVTLVALEGEFDAFNLPAVGEQLDALVEKGARKLVFNLSKLRFVGSSALGYLIKTRKQLDALGGELVVSDPSGSFAKTVAALGLSSFFRVCTDDEAALAYFAKA